MTNGLYLGLISGTSMDAVDCALVDIRNGLPSLLAHHAKPIPGTLKQRLQRLCSNRDIDLKLMGSTDMEVARLFAETAMELLKSRNLNASDIIAIGSHGQTIWHEPPQRTGTLGFSLQIGDPNTIAERTRITTVADFRRRDMAAGGHGAPIVPVLHHALFQSHAVDRIVLNLGGIANITVLKSDGSQPIGFDTGPASALMDGWVYLHRRLQFDAGGRWAASEEPHAELLALLLDEPFFNLPSPKSTGRELFNQDWLRGKLAQLKLTPDPAVVQATLLALTVESVAREVEKLLAAGEVLVCGGGARNTALLRQLAKRLPGFRISNTTQYGLDADFVEATAFAWFAYRTLKREALDFRFFTGAEHAVIAGGVYYA